MKFKSIIQCLAFLSVCIVIYAVCGSYIAPVMPGLLIGLVVLFAVAIYRLRRNMRRADRKLIRRAIELQRVRQCTACNSNRILVVGAKCSSLLLELGDRQAINPTDPGCLFTDANLFMAMCLDCGRVHGEFPAKGPDGIEAV